MKDINCIAMFNSDLCEFHILDSKKMIGSARLSLRLYQIKANGSPTRQTHKVASLSVQGHVFDSNKESEIMLSLSSRRPKFCVSPKVVSFIIHQ